jgi:acyl-coenzyme A synthetase/AMP-(fatty) acid ligase
LSPISRGAKKVVDFGRVQIAVGDVQPRDGWADFDAGLRAADAFFDPPPTAASDPGIIYFTSGTTRHPKMVLHTQASYGLGHKVTASCGSISNPATCTGIFRHTVGPRRVVEPHGPWHAGACIFALERSRKVRPGRVSANVWRAIRSPLGCAPPTALRLIVREDLS